MRKALIAVAVATALFAVGAFAASFGVQSEDIASGTNPTTNCAASADVDFIELLPPTMVIERISGDAPPDYFIGPTWCLDKPAVKLAIEAKFARRESFQGRGYQDG